MQSHEEGWKHPTENVSVSKKRGLSPMLIGLALLMAVAVIFVLQNRKPSKVNFLFFHYDGRQWGNILVAMAVGVLLDRLFSLWWHRRKREPKRADS